MFFEKAFLKITLCTVALVISDLCLANSHRINFQYSKKYYDAKSINLGRGFSIRKYLTPNPPHFWERMRHGSTLYYKGKNLGDGIILLHTNYYTFYDRHDIDALMLIDLKTAKTYPLQGLKPYSIKLLRENIRAKQLAFQCGEHTYILDLHTMKPIKQPNTPKLND